MNTLLLPLLFLAGVSGLVCAESSRDKRQSGDSPVVFPDDAPTQEEDTPCTTPNNREGTCHSASLCVFQFDDTSDLERSACTKKDGERGVCCPTRPSPPAGQSPVRPVTTVVTQPVNLPDISASDLDTAGLSGRSILQQISQIEAELRRRGLVIREGTKEAFHQAFFNSDKRLLVQIGQDGLVGVQTTLQLSKTFQLNSVQGRDGLRHFSLHNTIIKDTCPKPVPCPSSKYRTSDGSCNNRQNPSWGKSFTPFTRLLPPRYFDGITAPRIAYDGGPLPSAREVSYKNTPDQDVPNRRFTLLFMQWAQFLDHDLTLTALTTAQNGDGISCCDEEIQQNPRLRHPACFPIKIAQNDPFFAKFRQNCMEFVRSLPAPRPECTLGPREQLNQLTAFLDGSQIYGSTANETRQLRSFRKGKLKSRFVSGEEILPLGKQDEEACVDENFCFKAGDTRVNEQPLLATMHTIWMREHNRIAEELSRLNPGWTDEILFHEVRRIVGAELQHITFSEFLPLLLGKKVMSSFRLLPKLVGHTFDYDKDLNPSIINGFATAAYRLGHTLVQSNFDMVEETGEVSRRVPLASHFFDPTIIQRPGNLNKLVRGCVSQPAQTFDRYVTTQLTNHLFEDPQEGFGLDLVALNIQRGRDHGLPGYNEWREHCGLPRITSFVEMEKFMPPDAARTFSKLYRNVDDIDLFPAGIDENPLPDATLGPTFACIAAEQFRRLKFGDRFWYENGGQESSFSQDQLQQIRKVTLARILCDNTAIDAVQQVAFIRPAEWNPRVACSRGRLPRMNLTPWRNEPVWA